MSEKLNFKGSFQDRNNTTHSVLLSLYSFEENGVQIIYSPALDISGYGNNAKQAKSSFEITLAEFVKYTTNKGTLFTELKKLGWQVPRKNAADKNFSAPRLEKQLTTNDYLADIFNSKEFTKTNKRVELPVAA